MPSELAELLQRIGDAGYVRPPADPETLARAAARSVPATLMEFYSICDGAFFGDGGDFQAPDGRRFRLHIPQLAELTTTQEFGYIFADSPHYGRSAKWWQIVDCGDGNWLAFDSHDSSTKPIIEVFHESAGESEAQMVVAHSLEALLQRFANEKPMYWLEDDFEPLGYI